MGNPAEVPLYEKVTEEHIDEALRKLFRRFNMMMVALWRAGLGRWSGIAPETFGRIVVVENKGRKSGRSYRTPLNYTPVGNNVYCIAAFGEKTDWYRNVMTGEDTVIWLPDGCWTVAVFDGEDELDRLDLIRKVLIDSGFAARSFGFRPRAMSDDELSSAVADYRLVRFELRERLDRGPSDLAWVWVPLALSAAFVIVRKIRNCR